jgi:hypothetical protein
MSVPAVVDTEFPEDYDQPRALSISRKSGRPIFRKTTKWRPKTWKPYHEQIVLLHCLGRTNISLAEEFKRSAVHISNILNSPQGVALKKQIFTRVRASTLATIPQRLDSLTDAAIEICEEVMIKRRDDIIERSPLALLDRSMKILQGVGKLKGDESVHSTTINMNINNQIALVKGLEKANLARQLHTKEIVQETT